MARKLIVVTLLALALAVLASCTQSEEPGRIALPVVIDGQGARELTNDLGYSIQLTTFRLAVRDPLSLGCKLGRGRTGHRRASSPPACGEFPRRGGAG